MATNTPVPEQETIFVRGSEEHKEYLKHQFGTIKTWVNGFETRIAVAGRAMLLIYVIYITVKAGAGAALPQNIPWLNAGLLILDVFMLALQVLGLEGSVPGLIHLADELESKGKDKEAESVRRAAGTAQFLIAATAIDVVLQYSPHVFTISGTRLDMSGFAFGYDKLLFIVRLIVIGQYLKAMARLEQKGPKVISKHEATKKAEEQEQKHIRMDNAAILAIVNQAQNAFQTEQARLFADLQQQLAGVQSQIPTIDTQGIAETVLASLESTLAGEMKALQSTVMHQVSVTVASEMEELVTSDRYKSSSISSGMNHSSAITRKLPAVTTGNVRQFPQKSLTTEDTGAAIIRVYLEDTSRSQRAIAALVGTSEATVNRRLKEYLATQQNPSISTDVTA